MTSRYVSSHSGDYVINCRDRCRASPDAADRSPVVKGKLFLLILVHSAVDHFERRARIRRTWANESLLLTSHSVKSRDSITVRMETVFVVGRTPPASVLRRPGDAERQSSEGVTRVQSQLEEEAVRHGDILQGNFIDTYRSV